MSIPNCILTKKGQALLAKTPSGAEIPVTRWQMGTGVLAPELAVEDMTALVSPLQYLPISSCSTTGNKATILGQFVNTGMSEFVWEELGLLATDPDEGEILYAVGEARGNGETIEAGTVKLREFVFGMELSFDNAANVSTVIDTSLIFATREELDAKADKADLDKKADLGEDGKVVPEQLPQLGTWRRVFEVEQWDDEDGALHIPKTEHGMTPTEKYTMSVVRQRVDRTALDYYGDAAAQGRLDITAAMKAALAANESAPDTYPTAEDGHVQLTWHQVQYYLLEKVLTSDTEAQAKAAEKGFDWQDRDITGAASAVTLDQVLTAAYIPALDGSSATLDSLCTDVVLQSLRLRRKADNVGTVTKYDLDGKLVAGGWGAIEAQVYWDLETQDLVVRGDPFAGDLCVLT